MTSLAPSRRPPAIAAAAALVALAAATAGAQVEIAPSQQLDFDRPEAWGMKFAAAVLTLTPQGATRGDAGDGIELAVEVASVPDLSREERRIGFVGTKVEDIDRAPAIGRLRLRFGLPRGWRAELGLVPPVELDGLEPRFAALGLARTLGTAARLRFDGRVQIQGGRLLGDITCSRADVAAGDDPEANPFDCEAPSRDELELLLIGADLVVAVPVRREGGIEPYLALGAQHLDGTFRVDARYGDVHDRSRLATAGWTWSVTAGAGAVLRAPWSWNGEVYYSSLSIRRPGHRSENEPVLDLRLALVRAWR